MNTSLKKGTLITSLKNLDSILATRKPIFYQDHIYTASWFAGMPKDRVTSLIQNQLLAEAIPSICED